MSLRSQFFDISQSISIELIVGFKSPKMNNIIKELKISIFLFILRIYELENFVILKCDNRKIRDKINEKLCYIIRKR